MEKKENFLSKINLKDYTNKLEKVLDKKNFSLDAKNLLLSMMYKIENSYHDYEKVKREVLNKSEFLEQIIDTVEQKCNEIIIAKLNSSENDILEQKNLKYIVDKEEGKIIVNGNESVLLYAILDISKDEIILPPEQDLLKNPVNNLLKTGSNISEDEVIRDFNGWSWDIVTKDIRNLNINIIYQNLLFLLGKDFVYEFIRNKNMLVDYFSLMQDRINVDLIEWICKLAIDVNVKEDEAEKTKFINCRDINRNKFEEMQDKKEYLNKITEQKKKCTKEIERIDLILNNKDLLKEEYVQRNEKLPNKEKIFSINHLSNKLEEERAEILRKIKEYNKIIDPIEFVNMKHQLQENVNFLNKLDLEDKEDIKNNIIELCILFLDDINKRIKKVETKKEIVDLIYIIRYYRFIPFSEELKIKDIEKLNKIIIKIEKDLIRKAIEHKVIYAIAEDKDVNDEIIMRIFDSKIIDLDNIIIETEVKEDRIIVSYYDTTILETSIEILNNKKFKIKKKEKLMIRKD